MNKKLYILLAILAIAKLLISPHFGLGVDEAHYILYAKYLNFSYFDHPPLVAWTHAIIYYTLGTNELLARLPAIILFTITSYLVYDFILRTFKNQNLALYATLAVNLSFVLNVLSFTLMPDSLLFPLVFLLIKAIRNIEENKNKKINWILAGLILGLAGLAKYTAILFIPAIISYLIIEKRLDLIFNKNIIISISIALIMISPVIYYNINNDFASFKYQSSHVVGGKEITIKYFLNSLLVQFLAYSPFLSIFAYIALIKGFKEKNKDIRLALLLALSIFLFFTYSSFYKKILPHWLSLCYLIAIPIGIGISYKSSKQYLKKYIKISIIISSIIVIIIYLELIFKLFAFSDFKSPFRDIYGIDKITNKAIKIIKNDKAKDKVIALVNWTQASRVKYYNKSDIEVFVLDNRYDQFDYWEKNKKPINKDLLFINTKFNNENISETFNCEKIEFIDSLDIKINNKYVNKADFIFCRNFKGMK